MLFGLGNTFRSLTMSPMNSVLQQVRRHARAHFETGGVAVPASKDAKKQPVPQEEYLLPSDIDAAEVMAAIEAKLGGSARQRQRDEADVL